MAWVCLLLGLVYALTDHSVSFNSSPSSSASEDSNLSTETRARNAKKTLQGLKSIKRALAIASESVEETLGHVTDQSSDALRIVGFASLPDDILARIFEINHKEYFDEAVSSGVDEDCEDVCSSNVLAQVCQRFRRIALHIPSLWEVVSNAHGKDWVSIAKRRCRNPAVFVSYDVPGMGESLSNFLKSTRLAESWKVLDVRFKEKVQIRDFVDRVSVISDGQFSSLEKLSLQLEWLFSYGDASDDSEDEDASISN